MDRKLIVKMSKRAAIVSLHRRSNHCNICSRSNDDLQRQLSDIHGCLFEEARAYVSTHWRHRTAVLPKRSVARRT